jgi:hypothetical protein
LDLEAAIAFRRLSKKLNSIYFSLGSTRESSKALVEVNGAQQLVHAAWP